MGAQIVIYVNYVSNKANLLPLLSGCRYSLQIWQMIKEWLELEKFTLGTRRSWYIKKVVVLSDTA